MPERHNPLFMADLVLKARWAARQARQPRTPLDVFGIDRKDVPGRNQSAVPEGDQERRGQ